MTMTTNQVLEKDIKDGLETSVDAVSVEHGQSNAFQSDGKLDRRLMLRRDFILLPTVGLLYMIMFLDRTNIANAKIEGLTTDLSKDL